MKILFINGHYLDAMGGSEFQCHLVAMELKQLGHEVIYGVINPSKRYYDVPYRCMPLRRKQFYADFKRTLDDESPDVIYWRCAYTGGYLFGAAMYSRICKIALVYGIAHRVPNNRLIPPIPYRFASSSSQAITEHLKKFIGLCYVFISDQVNYNGFYLVDAITYLNDDTVGKLPARRYEKICDVAMKRVAPFSWKRPYVAWVANLKSIKNPEKFIDLARQCHDLDVDFLMVGSVSRPYEYVKDKAGLPSNLHYLGPKSLTEVNGILQSSLFLVHTCNPEGFPNNFIQAWTMGKPTVSLYYDPDSIIESQGVGFFSRTAKQLVRDVKRLVNDAALREEMGSRAKQFALQHFDAKTNSMKLERLFKEVAWTENVQ